MENYMKKLSFFLFLLLLLSLLLSSCNTNDKQPSDDTSTCEKHEDADDDELCDACGESIFFVFELFAFNDLHGVFSDTDSDVGVARLTTYLKTAAGKNSIILSSGDTWQGSSESNLTSGLIMTEWMNAIGVAAMTLGNHEFDWGEDAIEQNAALAEFP